MGGTSALRDTIRKVLFHLELWGCAMKRFVGKFVLSGLVVVAATVAVSPALAAPRKSALTVAIEALALGMGDEHDVAFEYLNARQDVFTAGARDIKAVVAAYPNDSDVARRLLDFAVGKGEQGCRFSATLVSADYPAWVAGVLKRYPDGFRCDALDQAVGRIPSWAEPATTSRETEVFLLDLFPVLARAGNQAGAAGACRFLDDGPDNVRMAAADVIAAVRPEGGLNCLVKSFDREKNRQDTTTASYFLESIGRFGGAGAWPHIVAALDVQGQFDRACSMLIGAGVDGYQVMLMVIKTTGGRAPSVMKCLSTSPESSEEYMLPLLKDKSRDLRNFALDYFSTNHSASALAVMKAGFIDNNPVNALGVPRERILQAMSGYPVEQIEDMVELALTDNDDRIRDEAMAIIRARKSLNFADAIRLVAETDPNRMTRAQALGILWYLGDFEAEPLLIRMAQYEESGIAAEATRVLGYVGSGSCIPTLRKIAAHEGGDRATAALESLAFLGLTTSPSDAVFAGVTEARPGRSDSVISCGDFRGAVLGSNGPVLMALPGGPGMDSLWARPWMDSLARKAVLVFVEPTRNSGVERVTLTPQDFECFASSFPDRKIVLISDGLGGTAAQWLAFQIPNRIDGLITISAPIPRDLDRLSAATTAALPRPFGEFAADLAGNSSFFRTEAYDYYMLKALAPALTGGTSRARSALRLKYNSRRLANARYELSRDEVRFLAMEVNKPAMWILPSGLMPDADVEVFRSVVRERPDMFGIAETNPDCGMMPQLTCDKQVLKYIRVFLKEI